MSKKHALQIFRAALQAADPGHAIARHLRFDGKTIVAGRKRYKASRFDRIFVIGAGKAGASMARAVERIFGRRITGGIVNVPEPGRVRRITLNPATHPDPDAGGLAGAHSIAEIARHAGERDLLICLISGGASALLPMPSAPVTLDQMQTLTSRLRTSGATIHELNTVRKHIEELKGGQLAKLAAPATVIALILSDVVGDDLDVIGSGPTVGDRSTIADAAAILEKYALPMPPLHETPKPGDPALAHVNNVIIGSNRQAIDAAAKQARALGYRVLVLSTFIEGEARDIAWMHAAIVKEIRSSGRPARAPVCILSGGETTVTVRDLKGVGGRNQEFVLAAVLALENFGPVTIFSAGTDGIDGPTDAAGAIADERTLAAARARGLDPRAFLAANDSYRFFAPLNALVKTGPTGTNVMDVRMILVD